MKNLKNQLVVLLGIALVVTSCATSNKAARPSSPYTNEQISGWRQKANLWDQEMARIEQQEKERARQLEQELAKFKADQERAAAAQLAKEKEEIARIRAEQRSARTSSGAWRRKRWRS